jgi:pimeloyl-ACP methyl ester carboxylesterase
MAHGFLEREVRVPQGVVHVREGGTGETIVFVHGALTNGRLWSKTADRLKERFRVIMPDLPLGSHALPMHESADLSVRGCARLLVDLLEAMALPRATLVGSDTGGVLCQLVMTEHAHRVARVVLTPCDAYEVFLPPIFKYLKMLSRIPGGLLLLGNGARLRATWRFPMAYGWLAKRPLDDATMRSFTQPLAQSAGVRRDTQKLLSSVSESITLSAAERFKNVRMPVLIAWSTEDKCFPFYLAKRLARDLTDAHLAVVDDSYSFIAQDQPEKLSALIAEHMGRASLSL